ncbi:ornithine carbamoyltransferase [Acidiferrimicrobium sp. IK]|uniref:ornithine carbamoyltransferase n=1 Tax=Acidiferrimicrobium sp. IK TaxID=2871700 RepID=UPI0021CB8081|nr:ornithine carbamoyltransferase [Acidiferrimicrobium sp. IK]MCU4184766.1 ornithine carbamoyltransferase [Acidiferrimicrobium sp. IK]
MRHVLDIDNLTPDDLTTVLDLAEVVPAPQVMAGRGAALIFEKPSNRTRNSTEMAVVGLGGHPVTIRAEEIGLGVREPVRDVTMVLAQYHAVLGARVFEHRVLEEMAALDVIPVVNLLSDVAHPCQALADLLTLRQRWGALAGRTLAWVGDGNNVARSLTLAAAMSGITVRVACPPGHGLDEVALDAARGFGPVEVVATPADAVAGADVVVTDTWVSMGQEDQQAARLDAFAGYQVNSKLMSGAGPDAVFLHCLPAHRGEEVTAEVIDGPASLVWAEAANRMHAARGLLQWILR